jgi:hypothetical protein
MDEEPLWRSLKELGFDWVEAFDTLLPNGKKLKRMDFAKPVK